MDGKITRTSKRIGDRFLGLIEKTPLSDRLLLRVAFFAVVCTGVWLLLTLNQHYSTTVPTSGGTLTEGIIGTPRFINPVLAFTKADQDVTALVYSGLMRIDENGELVPDLAEDISIAEDNRTYTITVRRDAQFHDGTPLTARDVVYTLQLIQDPDLKSPLRGNWSDVSITEIDEYALSLTLAEPYAPFMENLTIGIMPAHAWSSLPVEQLPFSQLNTEPIGAGPYQITDSERDTSGLITKYTLQAAPNHHEPPNISEISLQFFQNESALLEALRNNTIDSTAYLATSQLPDLNDSHTIISEPLPRLFGIFFNQNRSTVLLDSAVRKALATAIDRDSIITDVVDGYGVPTATPLPGHLYAVESDVSATSGTTTGPEAARSILSDAGWTQNEAGLWEKTIDENTVTLEITIRTSNTPVFASMVDNIATSWEAAGIAVATEQFEQTGLVQSVIRPRDFEVLLFGLDMNRSYDLYPFWHSSQQDDPGLNIAQYANVEVDDLLDSAHETQDNQERAALLTEASNIIADETPAIMLFQPEFTYVTRPNVTVTPFSNLARPADRFSTIPSWYTEKASLWPWFRTDQPIE